MPGVAVKCARLGGSAAPSTWGAAGSSSQGLWFLSEGAEPRSSLPGVMAELRAGTKRVQKRQPGKAASLLLLLPSALYLNVPSGSSRQGGLGSLCPPQVQGMPPAARGAPFLAAGGDLPAACSASVEVNSLLQKAANKCLTWKIGSGKIKEEK